jgi:hypothetical protein
MSEKDERLILKKKTNMEENGGEQNSIIGAAGVCMEQVSGLSTDLTCLQVKRDQETNICRNHSTATVCLKSVFRTIVRYSDLG